MAIEAEWDGSPRENSQTECEGGSFCVERDRNHADLPGKMTRFNQTIAHAAKYGGAPNDQCQDALVRAAQM